MLDGIADRVQASVSYSGNDLLLPAVQNRCGSHDTVLLLEMAFLQGKHILRIDIMVLEYMIDPLRRQLLVRFVGDILHQIPHFLPHLLGQADTETLLQYVVYAALSGLAVDPDHVRIISSAHVLRIDRKVRNTPLLRVSVLPPGHSLCNGILVRSGKCSEYKLTRIGLAGGNIHSCQPFIDLADLAHIGEIQPRIYPVGKHIHCQGDDIHIPGPFSVSKEGSFNPVRPCQNPKLRRSHAGSPVIVGMKADDRIFPVFHIFTEIFHLARKYMGKGIFYGCRKVDDGLVLRRRLPYVQYRVAHLHGVFHLCTGKALRTVFKSKVSFRLLRQLFQKLRSVDGNLLHLLLIFPENLLPLCHGSRIVYMYYCMRSPLDRLKGPFYDVFPRLCQHLDRHILRNHISFDQCTHELVFCLRCRREPDLNLFESHIHKQLEKLHLFIQAHGLDQRLVAIPQVYAAPGRRMVDIILFHPVITVYRRHKISPCVLFIILHLCISLYYINNIVFFCLSLY